MSCSICVNPTAVLITTGKNPISAPRSMFGRMPYPSQMRKSGAMATLGNVLTNTRKGVSARDTGWAQAIAAPRRTPAKAAVKNAPRISTAVIQMCFIQGISPGPIASNTERGLGSKYSRTPRRVTAICHTATKATNTIVPGKMRCSATEAFIIFGHGPSGTAIGNQLHRIMCCTTARRVHREHISSLGYRHVESEHYATAHDGVAVTRWESRRRALGAGDSAPSRLDPRTAFVSNSERQATIRGTRATPPSDDRRGEFAAFP